MGLIDAKRTRLSAVLRNVGTAVTYVYDYGDDWEHELLLESILMPDPDAIYPLCIAGQRCCPPEDVGGIAGYADYLEAMADLHSKSKVSTPRKPIATLKPFVNRSQMTKTLITSIIPRVQRAPLKSGETVLLELNQRERDLIIAHSLADESLTNRLQITQPPGQRPKFQFTLDELDELAGNLAAEANHSKNKVLQEQLDQLCDRIEGFLTRYTHRDA